MYLTEIENRRILFLCDVFRETDLGIDFISNTFRGTIQIQDYFRYFLHLFSVPSFIISNTEGGLFLLTLKGLFIQRMASLMVIPLSTKCFLFIYMYIDLLKRKAYKLFENSDADLSWLLFKEANFFFYM